MITKIFNDIIILIIRTYNKAVTIKYTNYENLLARTNAQIGTLKNYNCRKIILNYAKLLPKKVQNILNFSDKNYKFNFK